MEPMNKEQKIQQLCRLLASVQDEADIAALFEDLCTHKELENMQYAPCEIVFFDRAA